MNFCNVCNHFTLATDNQLQDNPTLHPQHLYVHPYPRVQCHPQEWQSQSHYLQEQQFHQMLHWMVNYSLQHFTNLIEQLMDWPHELPH